MYMQLRGSIPVMEVSLAKHTHSITISRITQKGILSIWYSPNAQKIAIARYFRPLQGRIDSVMTSAGEAGAGAISLSLRKMYP